MPRRAEINTRFRIAEKVYTFWNDVQNQLNTWLKAGRPDKDTEMANTAVKRYDVRASVYEINGTGADGAYSLVVDAATPEDIGKKLTETLQDDWGLSNSKGPFRLEINIGPAGTGDDLPL